MFDVKGKTINDLLNMDIKVFNSLSQSELKKVVNKLNSAANKRLGRFQDAEDLSPAYKRVMKSGGKFSTKGKDLNALRTEFVRAATFLKYQTSTIKGWNKVRDESIVALKALNIEVTKEFYDEFWQVYEKLKKSNPEVRAKMFKYSVLKEIASIMDDNIEPEKVLAKMQKDLDKIYEQSVIEYEDDSISEFFEM